MPVAGDDVRRVGRARGGGGGDLPVPPLAAEAGDGSGAQHVLGARPPDGHRAPGTVPAVVPRLPRAPPAVVLACAAAARRRASREGERAAAPRRLGRLRLDGVRPEERVVQAVLLVRRHAVDGVAVLALKQTIYAWSINRETDRKNEKRKTQLLSHHPWRMDRWNNNRSIGSASPRVVVFLPQWSARGSC